MTQKGSRHLKWENKQIHRMSEQDMVDLSIIPLSMYRAQLTTIHPCEHK